jgi:hypothetical protein
VGPTQNSRSWHRGHQQFDRAGGIHFLAHDAFDLPQHAQAQRHPGVDAARQRLDQPRPQHQAVAGQFGLGRGFLERGKIET